MSLLRLRDLLRGSTARRRLQDSALAVANATAGYRQYVRIATIQLDFVDFEH